MSGGTLIVSRHLFCLTLMLLVASLIVLFSVVSMASVSRPCVVRKQNHGRDHVVTVASQPTDHCFDRLVEFGPSSTEPGSGNEFAQLFYSWPKEGKSIHKWVQYFDVYNRHLKHLKARRRSNKVVRLLEIGSGDGGSLQMWPKYFGGSQWVRLFGVDVKPESQMYANNYTTMIVGDQGDEEFLKKTLPAALPDEPFDVVMDDGSHQSSHQIATFRHTLDLLGPGGVYLCEDTATSYWPGGGFGGSIDSSDSFISALVKRLLDVVHAHNVRPEIWDAYVSQHLVPLSFVLRRPDQPMPSEAELRAEQQWWSSLRSKIDNVHVYDQIVVIEKRTNTGGFAVRMPENITTEIKHYYW